MFVTFMNIVEEVARPLVAKKSRGPHEGVEPVDWLIKKSIREE